MSKENTRLYVICHMLSALDGKISGNYFSAPELIPVRNEMGKIRDRACAYEVKDAFPHRNVNDCRRRMVKKELPFVFWSSCGQISLG